MGIDLEGHLTFARVERKTPVFRPALQSKQSSLCNLHCSSDRGKEDQMAKSSLYREQLTEEGREQVDH